MIIWKKHLEHFFDHLNLVEATKKFTLEAEKNEKTSFLDVLAIRQLDGLIKTDYQRKPATTESYLNFCF